MYRTDFNKLYRTETRKKTARTQKGRDQKDIINRLDRTKLTIARVILGSTGHSKR